jgi:NADPH-dependent curcumin reductase CurA
MKIQQWVLAKPVVGLPALSDFELQSFDARAPVQGEMLVEVLFHTVAPGIRARIGADTYAARIEVGQPIPGMGVGTVLDSASEKFRNGDIVIGQFAWATHAFVSETDVTAIDKESFRNLPLYTAIGAMGPSGLTAYFGVTDILNVQPGETVVVSSAAGAVGCIAGQIAKILGCYVIGIAGGQSKCQELIEKYSFDRALDYRAPEDLSTRLRALLPEGADAYFDNVGGPITDTILTVMKPHGRVAVCGQTSEYNLDTPRGWTGVTNIISRRLTVRGFIVFDFHDRFEEARTHLGDWIRAKRLIDEPNVLSGIDKAVSGFVSQFSDNAPGRLLIEVQAQN